MTRIEQAVAVPAAYANLESGLFGGHVQSCVGDTAAPASSLCIKVRLLLNMQE